MTLPMPMSPPPAGPAMPTGPGGPAAVQTVLQTNPLGPSVLWATPSSQPMPMSPPPPGPNLPAGAGSTAAAPSSSTMPAGMPSGTVMTGTMVAPGILLSQGAQPARMPGALAVQISSASTGNASGPPQPSGDRGEPPTLPSGTGPAHGDMTQIVFQQSLGNLAQVLPTMLGDALHIENVWHQPGTMPANSDGDPDAFGITAGQMRPSSSGHAASQGGHGGDVLPWRDLRRFHQHLSRLLGRQSQHRSIPPAHTPGGELHYFLGMLHGATSQLGVAISDFQASLIDGGAPPTRSRLQFAMALVAAARTLRGMATALQSGPVQGPAEQEVIQTPVVAQQVMQAPPSLPRDVVLGHMLSSDSEEAGRALSQHLDAMGDPSEDEVLEVFLEPIPEAVFSATMGAASAPAPGVALGSDGSVSAGPFPEVSPPLLTPWHDEQEMNAMFRSYGPPYDRLAGPPPYDREAGGTSPSAGISVPDPLASLPPEVVACWDQWTRPEIHRRVIAEARQPPFSTAYLSGDATGSHRPQPQAPPPPQPPEAPPQPQAPPPPQWPPGG